MKAKHFILLAVMLCIGAFIFPTTAYASEDVTPPAVAAAVDGEILRVEASGGFLGVEAIFINEQRFNFRVDGVLSVDLLAFRDSEIITVYAVDFAGNTSNIAVITNPHYVGLANQPDQPQSIPVTPPPSNPFTPAGQASVLDNASNDDEKEFFTFTTPAGNVFFLIVDRQRGSDNVYFLNAVTERDLIALAEQAGQEISGGGGIPVSTAPQTPNEGQPDEPEPTDADDTPAPNSGGNGNGTMIFLLVAVAVAGGVGYYFKIVRPKRQATTDYDDEDEDEDDMGEEMAFEDEAEEPGVDRDGDYYNTEDGEDDGDEPEVEDDGL